MVRTTAAIASKIAISGLARPPVVPVDAALVATVPTCTVPAAPPPAIHATDHCNIGSNSPNIDAETKTPASAAAGVATTSNKLSIHGIK